MNPPMTMRDQLAYLIDQKPGISSVELSEFYGPKERAGVSGMLTKMYREGGYRREKDQNYKGRSRKPFRYTRDGSVTPVAEKRAIVRRTPAGEASEIERLNQRIAELEAWRADALSRYPDLGVPAEVLSARKLVAEQLREDGDVDGAKRVLSGQRDRTVLIRVAIRALEVA